MFFVYFILIPLSLYVICKYILESIEFSKEAPKNENIKEINKPNIPRTSYIEKAKNKIKLFKCTWD